MTPENAETRARYVLMDEAPNNAVLRHFGVWDREADDYATTSEFYCYGLTLAEAERAVAELTAPENAEKGVVVSDRNQRRNG